MNKYISKESVANLIFILLIFNAIWSIFYSKDAWVGYDAKQQVGWQYQLSKYIYAIIILIMVPYVFCYRRYFDNLVIMAGLIVLHIIYAFAAGVKFDISNVSKFFMLCLAFPFFSYTLRSSFNKTLLKIVVIAISINLIFNVLQADTLSSSIMNGSFKTGQGTAIAIIYLLPIFFYVFKDKISSYFFLLGFIIVFISLRRTAIIAYIMCLPFVFSRINKNVSKKTLMAIIILLSLLAAYAVANYWYIIELRFMDMFETDANGNYGSGRSDWFVLLLNNYTRNPEYWIQGAGPQQVEFLLHKAGYPFRVAHNDILELLLGYGLFGLFLWLYTFYKLYKLSRIKAKKQNRKLVDMSILSYIFISFVSGAIFNSNFIVLPIFYGLVLNRKKI